MPTQNTIPRSVLSADSAKVQPARAERNVAISHDQIARFCRRHHIQRLALFGSVLRDDFRRDSDIDVLVEFEPDHVPGFGFIGLQRELSELLGREVDLNTPRSLSRYFRDEVLAEAEDWYVQN